MNRHVSSFIATALLFSISILFNCSSPSLFCRRNEDCSKDGRGEFCCLGRCVQNQLRCEIDLKFNSKCEKNEDCEGGKVCSGGLCIEAECMEDGDCGGGICREYKCESCVKDEDCGGKKVCSGGLCIEAECMEDADCGDQICREYKCEDCVKDEDCGPDRLCIQGLCVKGNCRNSGDCKGGKVCKNNICSPCSSHKDCRDAGICLKDKGICFDSALFPKEVLIPSGSFRMGAPKTEKGWFTDESPVITVKLTHDFWMWKSEVTQGEFKKYMGYNPSYFRSCGLDCPVEYLNWHEAAAFCNALSQAKNLPQCFVCKGKNNKILCSVRAEFRGQSYYNCKGWRLPTEAEWEYAYRAGSTTAFYNGDITNDLKDPNLDKIGWYKENSSGTPHPVMRKQPNKWGLYDMAGNVWEWVFDRYSLYPSISTPLENPVGALTSKYRVARGGSWGLYSRYCRAATRSKNSPSFRNWGIGFRPVRTRK